VTKTDHFRQRCPHAFLIVGDQDTHELSRRSFHASDGK
jgi:hypothetical protein